MSEVFVRVRVRVRVRVGVQVKTEEFKFTPRVNSLKVHLLQSDERKRKEMKGNEME